MMTIRSALAGIAAIALLATMPASAATLLVSKSGYTGRVMIISPVPYVNTAGPFSLGPGIRFTSTSSNSVVGIGGYGVGANGSISTTPIIGTNSPSAVITIRFATPVAAFGADMNYANYSDGSVDGDDPVIAAYDGWGGLIASYNLHTLAPIDTPGGLDAFAFRGIDGGGIPIASFTLQGAYIVAAGQPPGMVPEPGSWAMLIAGLGLVGAVARRRRALAA